MDKFLPKQIENVIVASFLQVLLNSFKFGSWISVWEWKR